MGKGYRPGRLGEEVRRIVSDMLLRGDLKDPRFVGMVSIQAVDVTPDGSYATLYVTALGLGSKMELSKEEKDAILAAFQSAKGKIKSEIGKKIKLRHIPELLFKFDTSMEYGLKMDKIISSLVIPEHPEDEEEDF